MQTKSSLARLAFGLFFVLNFAFFTPSSTHAAILSEPTGSCPEYLAAINDVTVATGLPNKYKLEKQPMQCKQGMCWRPQTPGGEKTIKTDIPCNYSVDDIFVTVLNVVRMIFGLTGAMALIIFIVGALYYFILSAGDSGKVKQGKSLMVNSIIAIMITFGAGAIVTFAVRSIGGNIETKQNGATGNIILPVAACPVGGTERMQCKKTSDLNNVTNMVCDYRALKPDQEGVCESGCDYEDATNGLQGGDSEWNCQDVNLLDTDSRRNCRQGLCPGAANVQCCKL